MVAEHHLMFWGIHDTFEHIERLWTSIDQISGKPEGILAGDVVDFLAQCFEGFVAAVDVANYVGCHGLISLV